MKRQDITFDEKEDLLLKKNLHLSTAELISKEFVECLNYCKNPENKTEMLTFDLQHALDVMVMSLKNKHQNGDGVAISRTSGGYRNVRCSPYVQLRATNVTCQQRIVLIANETIKTRKKMGKLLESYFKSKDKEHLLTRLERQQLKPNQKAKPDSQKAMVCIKQLRI